MSNDNIQNNIVYFLTDTKITENNETRILYKIVDGSERLKTAHEFHKATVKEASEHEMEVEMNKGYCDWYAKNRAVILTYYRNKKQTKN
ncbi:hypothetical protein [Tenacibaculum finnmarkense]|uniref:Uncharacterized protein n=1 Tax=Tenacibaculum finnmarkense genomovar finnmarkense TaxID=1458503 RepID=A0AAP1RGD7_9FLAO|nr:hypothetical protein [Tenacibaculum finnmarkense]MBE7653253.1 hypothetical protein [Tenacibaculum finnmarkense genomovar finnmarkense]MBE7661451.1 hypothetical protein [Tenacibaculum finnmarkense genomovar finnmarkense]MBE7695554.1 hypothetical protein [Tenacibaculum finnmarkense genomovar finnmarkense]MCD8427785.1 hypothetical protein [Tenacibaculum finnmarkense genomovar finnmarkense]MCG8253200.1 hypothetical protein [Tenacibaculum finnmarkense genomovar finnmarkense]